MHNKHRRFLCRIKKYIIISNVGSGKLPEEPHTERTRRPMSIWNWFGSDKLKECEDKARNDPDNPQVPFELGSEYERRGRHAQAIEAFHQTLKLNPRSAETHFNLGVLYEATENGRKAIFHMVQAGNLFSERNDTGNKDKARTRLKVYYKKFGFQSGEPPAAS